MNYIYAMLICGAICVITQLLAETKINFAIVAVIMVSVFGGLFTKFGIIDRVSALGAGGINVTALGCGNGAYGSGALLAFGQGPSTLLLAAAVNILVIILGCVAGMLLLKFHPDEIPGP